MVLLSLFRQACSCLLNCFGAAALSVALTQPDRHDVWSLVPTEEVAHGRAPQDRDRAFRIHGSVLTVRLSATERLSPPASYGEFGPAGVTSRCRTLCAPLRMSC